VSSYFLFYYFLKVGVFFSSFQTTAPVNKVIVELVKKAQEQQQGSPQLSAKFLQHAIS
jgi:hypothetical protein